MAYPPTVFTAGGVPVQALPVWAVNGSGQGSGPVSLASNATVGATSGTTQVTGVAGGSYIWDAQFTGTSIVLQSLGADGTTWRTVATLNAPGSTGVVIGDNATLRLYNPNGTSDTGVYSSIS